MKKLVIEVYWITVDIARHRDHCPVPVFFIAVGAGDPRNGIWAQRTVRRAKGIAG